MLSIRKAISQDSPLILSLIRELAVFERAPGEVIATEEDLFRDGFTSNPKFHVIIAEWNGEPAGMAFFFHNYSTWKGRPGIYLEDLYVRPQFRKRGIGRALLGYLARIALAENCYGIRWEVLEWNASAIEFYKQLGSEFRGTWQSMQLNSKELQLLADAKRSEAMKTPETPFDSNQKLTPE